MLEQAIEFRYQANAITGGYSFSAKNNIINLPEYVERISNPRTRTAIQYEAEKARYHYVAEVGRLKALGENKVDTFLVKREAVKKAKKETQTLYADVWQEVELIQKSGKIYETSKIEPETAIDIDCSDTSKGIKFLVTVKGADDIAQWMLCESAELTIKVVQS